MHLVVVPVGRVPLGALANDIRLARDRAERGDPVVVAHQFVGDRAGLDMARPAHQAGNAERAFPVGVLLRAEVRHGAVGPGVHVRAVVGGVDNDRVVGDAQVVEGLEDRADRLVVLDHAVDVLAVAVLVAAAVLGADVRAEVHARGVEPAEERFAGVFLPLHVVDGRGGGLVVDRLHPLLGQGPGVLDGLLADLAKARIDGGVVLVGRLAFRARRAGRTWLGRPGPWDNPATPAPLRH